MPKNSQTIKITVITGATATGKSKKAITLATANNAEIIYADSRAVYKGFDIVSAKPNIEEMQGVPHHLIDILTPDKLFSAGDFVNLASEKIKEINARGKNVIICGGTLFYIKSLLDEKELPEIKKDEKLRAQLQTFNCETLWQMLFELDAKRADEIDKNDKNKIIRSIEMCKAIGGKISEFKRNENKKYDAEFIILNLPREELYKKINERVDEMIEKGLHEEFLKLTKKWGAQNPVILNTIGYQEFSEFDDTAFAIEKIKQHTRNFAKRQLTFLRQFYNGCPDKSDMI